MKLPKKVHMLRFKLKKHSPEILMAVGVAGTITSAVLACRATLKINDILEEDKKNLEIIHEKADELIEDEKMPYTAKDKRIDLAKTYTTMGVKLVKLYAPSVILGSLSLCSIVGSHKIMKRRNIALSSAYLATDKAFKAYRNRIAEKYGEDKEYDIFHGIDEKVVEEEVTLKNGNKKIRKKKVRVQGDSLSPHARFFDDSSPYWKASPDANVIFLKMVQRTLNDKLQAQGYLFLNDVYKALGFKETKAGQIVGWLYIPEDANRDNYIDFGIWDGDTISKRAFVNGDENVVWLDFNVDGDILNDVFEPKTRRGFGWE